MIELFEQNIRTNDRQSSKGNQIKWENNGIWYKADYIGYEGLSEYIVSKLLSYSNLKEKEYVKYNPINIKYKKNIYNGVSSENFLKKGWSVITLERLFKNFYGQGLHESIWKIREPKERLKFVVDNAIKITGLKDFGKYMNKLLTIDCFFLNEDRHTHNIAVLMDENGDYDYCPIFDNGACLLSDTKMEYPIGEDIYEMIDSVKSKTISTNFEEQTEVSEDLFGMNLVFKFAKKDVEELLTAEESKIYSLDEKERVKKVIFEQMRKYPYLFE